jgi:hypothetical protein
VVVDLQVAQPKFGVSNSLHASDFCRPFDLFSAYFYFFRKQAGLWAYDALCVSPPASIFMELGKNFMSLHITPMSCLFNILQTVTTTWRIGELVC